jgi:D-lactate dehydrogenase (cytochrome)
MTSSRVRDLDALHVALVAILGDRCSRSVSDREQHGRGETHLRAAPPDLVVYPESTEEVQAVVRGCAAHDAPMVPFGAGSSLEGHIAAVQGGVSVDMTRMNRILRTSVEDMDATVEAGVTRQQLMRALAGTGVTFFIDPGADATLGGMTSTGASGTTSVRYGTMRENVLGLTVVLADGQVIRTGSRARKSSAGYDLTRLLVGAEGTLGIVTEVTVRLHPVPDGIAAAACAFPSVDAAIDAVVALLQCGVPLARIELLDELTVGAVRAFSGLDLPDSAMIFTELHAFSQGAIAEQLDLVREIVMAHGGEVHATATTEEDRARIWEARHKVYFAGLAMRPGSRSWTTDVCVPISHLASCIRDTRADCVANDVLAPLVGHVGDGNFHMLLLVDASDADAIARAKVVNDRLVARAIACGGTCTGEHGIGMGKIESLAKQHGDLLPLMQAIKTAFDPHNLMNPGKILGAPPA